MVLLQQHLPTLILVPCPQAIDLAFLQYTVAKTLQRSASVHLLFAFEYVIQASIVASTAIKYGLGVVDNLMEGRWESKVRRKAVLGILAALSKHRHLSCICRGCMHIPRHCYQRPRSCLEQPMLPCAAQQTSCRHASSCAKPRRLKQNATDCVANMAVPAGRVCTCSTWNW